MLQHCWMSNKIKVGFQWLNHCHFVIVSKRSISTCYRYKLEEKYVSKYFPLLDIDFASYIIIIVRIIFVYFRIIFLFLYVNIESLLLIVFIFFTR